eukprot:PLAT1769.1.p1 GENE.PLAT1769.1~~PLAT1769.1.p1  ORF type:complete len:352 (+),score=152.51 PLAT1769.1:24-1079(+)
MRFGAAFCLLLASVLAHSARGVLQSLSRNASGGYDYDTVVAALLTEVVKMAVCVVAILARWLLAGGSQPGERVELVPHTVMSRRSVLYAVPALLYAAANNLDFLVIAAMPSPVAAQVFASAEIVLVGILTVVVLKRRLQPLQWVSMLLLCNAIAAGQMAQCKDCQHLRDYPLHGMLLSLVSSGFAASAGIFTEKLLKEKEGALPFLWKNLLLYAFGALSNVFAIAFQKERPPAGLLSGFSLPAVAVVFVSAFLGLVTAAILVTLSNIVKVYASTTSLFLTALLSSWLLGSSLPLPFLMAMFNVCIAIYLFKAHKKGAAAGGAAAASASAEQARDTELEGDAEERVALTTGL